MGILVDLVGFSGAGKTRSIKTLLNDELTLPDDTIIIRALKKPFPFRNKMREWNKEKKIGDYVYFDDASKGAQTIKTFANYGKKRIIVDDSTFFMTHYFMETAFNVGYDKFTKNAKYYYDMLMAGQNTSDDTRVYFVNHLEETTNGMLKVKTIGKMLDEKVDIPALFTIILQATVRKKKHYFITNKEDDYMIAKSPEEMFSSELIENDLKAIDKAICDYYFIDS